jgi:hypothetical protein
MSSRPILLVSLLGAALAIGVWASGVLPDGFSGEAAKSTPSLRRTPQGSRKDHESASVRRRLAAALLAAGGAASADEADSEHVSPEDAAQAAELRAELEQAEQDPDGDGWTEKDLETQREREALRANLLSRGINPDQLHKVHED